jgi:hypothetical protein
MTQNQNEKGSPYTIDELIGVLEQQKRALGGDYFPRIRRTIGPRAWGFENSADPPGEVSRSRRVADLLTPQENK